MVKKFCNDVTLSRKMTASVFIEEAVTKNDVTVLIFAPVPLIFDAVSTFTCRFPAVIVAELIVLAKRVLVVNKLALTWPVLIDIVLRCARFNWSTWKIPVLTLLVLIVSNVAELTKISGACRLVTVKDLAEVIALIFRVLATKELTLAD